MKKRNILIGVAIVAILAIGTAAAYFTDMDQAVNSFTVGNIDIELQEPNWDPENGKNITPLKEIEKDPQIENTGANPAYVFMQVVIPRATVATVDNGSYVDAKEQDLFTYTVGEDWKEVAKEISNGNSIYVYGYIGDDGNMKTIASGETTMPVFESVQFINLAESLDKSKIDIKVAAVGIQADDISNVPEDVFKLIAN